ncbi:MAG: hypothetical protein MSD82_06720 [Prevotella sp.]|nr:hypothetical protein [Prevotella sp.]
MKTLKSILLAITMLQAAPAFLTSCQEDAPAINYTMNVSVINDFTKVVEAINNGSLKNEQAIQKLTEAIDQMNADQQTKLQAITDVLNSVNATIDTKLATIEAAMQAQTLMLQGKLQLLETAVNKQTLKIDDKGHHIATAIDNSKEERQHRRRSSPRTDHPEARGAQGSHRRRRNDPNNGICRSRLAKRLEVGEVQPRCIEPERIRRLLRMGRDRTE